MASQAAEKKRAKYSLMYDKISYDFDGFAIEIGGRGLGPAAEDLLTQLQKLWWNKMGKAALPDGANWTCPSFTSYWRQRLVGAAQGWTAAMGVARSRRVAELREGS